MSIPFYSFGQIIQNCEIIHTLKKGTIGVYLFLPYYKYFARQWEIKYYYTGTEWHSSSKRQVDYRVLSVALDKC